MVQAMLFQLAFILLYFLSLVWYDFSLMHTEMYRAVAVTGLLDSSSTHNCDDAQDAPIVKYSQALLLKFAINVCP